MPISRRHILAGAVAAPVAAAGGARAAAAAKPSTFVLVHGAWHGGWCWKRVRATLQAQGHRVFTPTLTGLCERSHLLTREVNLTTHVNDVVNLIRWEELSNVVLLGHSYGGAVISGAVEAAPERIGALVYLDAFVLKNGQGVLDSLPPGGKEQQLELAKTAGEGWKLPPAPAAFFNVNAADRAWVDHQCTPQPLATFIEPLKLSGAADRIKDVTYLRASDWTGSPFPPFYEMAKARGWRAKEIVSGHDVMLDQPARLADELAAIGARVDGPKA